MAEIFLKIRNCKDCKLTVVEEKELEEIKNLGREN